MRQFHEMLIVVDWKHDQWDQPLHSLQQLFVDRPRLRERQEDTLRHQVNK